MFEIIEGISGWGKISTDGTLGYESSSNDVMTTHSLDGYRSISAHSPSVVKIRLNKPVMLSGLLNCTAYLDRSNVVEFYVDYNYVGNVMIPGEKTEEIYLSPGIHELRIIHLGRNYEFRHSVWLLRETEEREVGELCVLVPAFFREDECIDKVRLLLSTARKQNVWLNLYGVGERFIDYTNAKSIRAMEEIKKLPDNYKYVIVCDGTDVAILQNSNNIIQSFCNTGFNVLCGSENECWPARNLEWAENFPQKYNGRNYINAGIFMGKRNELISVLEKIQIVYNDLREEKHKEEYGKDHDGKNIWAHRCHLINDQIIWQWLYFKNKIDIGLDSEFNVIGNTYGENIDELIKDIKCSLLHFSGPLKPLINKYAGMLGKFYR